jgi:hypothetical protein
VYIGAGEPAPRIPTTGIAGCCARAASGHAAAAPPTKVMNSRRLTSSTGLPPRFWTGGTRNDHQPADGPCSRFAAGSAYHEEWEESFGQT